MTKASWTFSDIPSQQGRVCIVTGANSGIGWHTALQLARAKAQVVLTARTPQNAEAAMARIKEVCPDADVCAELLDLAQMKSIRAFAARMANREKIDLLINNAGVMAVPTRQETQDGFELQLGTNYLGPFALTALLFPVLRRAAAPRVTMLTSVAANMGLGRICFEDFQWHKHYDPWQAYCQSKLADLMFSQELARRCKAAQVPVLSNAAHPGIARTALHTTGRAQPLGVMHRVMLYVVGHSAEQGAAPTLRAATSSEATAGCLIAPRGPFAYRGKPVPIALPRPSLNPSAAARLWDLSERCTGVHFPVY